MRGRVEVVDSIESFAFIDRTINYSLSVRNRVLYNFLHELVTFQISIKMNLPDNLQDLFPDHFHLLSDLSGSLTVNAMGVLQSWILFQITSG